MVKCIHILLVCLLATAWGSILKVEQFYLGDNIDFRRTAFSLSFDSIAVGGGFVSANAGYEVQTHASKSFGIAEFEQDYLSLQAGYARTIGKFAFSFFAQTRDILAEGFSDYLAAGGQISALMESASSGWRFTPEIALNYGPAEDNPVSKALAIRRFSLRADMGMGVRSWEWHLIYSQSWYGRVDREAYEQFLDTPDFLPIVQQTAFGKDPEQAIEANNLMHTGVFAFGPPVRKLPWLYLGLSATYSHMNKDFYFPLKTKIDTLSRVPKVYHDSTEYAHFPYTTPQNEFQTHIILAASFSTQKRRLPVSEGTLKASIPVFSRCSQYAYGQSAPGMITSFEKWEYTAKGLGPLTIELWLKKRFGSICTVGIKGEYFAKPYLPYRFWGEDCYWYGSSEVFFARSF
ncbi:MAG: hypothetical protein ACLFSB_10990 [Chitinispirillaceae bacterium]